MAGSAGEEAGFARPRFQQTSRGTCRAATEAPRRRRRCHRAVRSRARTQGSGRSGSLPRAPRARRRLRAARHAGSRRSRLTVVTQSGMNAARSRTTRRQSAGEQEQHPQLATMIAAATLSPSNHSRTVRSYSTSTAGGLERTRFQARARAVRQSGAARRRSEVGSAPAASPRYQPRLCAPGISSGRMVEAGRSHAVPSSRPSARVDREPLVSEPSASRWTAAMRAPCDSVSAS